MNILFAVVKDLYIYSRSIITDVFKFVFRLFKEKSAEPSLDELFPDAIDETIFSSEDLDNEAPEDIPQTFRSAEEVFKARPHPEKNTVMYTGGEKTAVFSEPTTEFDGVIARLPYGVLVMTLEQRGRWSRIVYREVAGWVLRDDLIDRSSYVYPEFVIGEPNLVEDPNTLRLRAFITDEFSGGLVGLPLQSSEYVLYRLLRKNKTISWTSVKPRTEGTWHTLLRGGSGVRVSVHPESDVVMEYTTEDGTGHLAYIDAVFPDETISISEVNMPDSGAYNERMLTKEEWQALRPVFIDFS